MKNYCFSVGWMRLNSYLRARMHNNVQCAKESCDNVGCFFYQNRLHIHRFWFLKSIDWTDDRNPFEGLWSQVSCVITRKHIKINLFQNKQSMNSDAKHKWKNAVHKWKKFFSLLSNIEQKEPVYMRIMWMFEVFILPNISALNQ